MPRTKNAAPRDGADERPDIVWGASAIGRVINRSPRQTFWLLENGAIPAQKIGNLWSASRARLLEHCAGGTEARS
jgi:hypothetical protein